MRFSTLATAVLAFATLAPAASAQSLTSALTVVRESAAPTTVKADESLVNIIQDPSFEAGRPPAQTVWVGTNPTYIGGSPILSPNENPAATFARTGLYFLILGSSPDAINTGVTQQVTAAAGAYTLQFYLQAGVNAGSDSQFFVQFNGTEVFRATPATAATYATYTLVSVPVTVATAGTYTLSFLQTKTATPLINWFVDDVAMDAPVAGASLTATPTSLAFGTTTTVNSSSAPRTVTLTNNGTMPVTITSITSSGAPFSVIAPATPLTLAAGATSTFTVTFTPTNTTAATGTVSIASNAAGSPLVINLTGTGMAPSTAVSYPSTDTPQPIPDNAPAAPLVSTIIIPASVAGTITDLDVDVNITHTWVGDLIGTVAKGAVSSIIFDRPGLPTVSAAGCSSNNMVIILDDEGTAGAVETSCTGVNTAEAYTAGGRYTPNNPLTVFDATTAAGTYTLTVSDNANLDTGTLNSWALLISTGGVAGEGSASAQASRLSVAPNPMRGAAQIDLTVGTAQDVRVALYDALGREVAVLLDRSMTAGQQAFVAVTTTGLPTGVYVVRATGTDLNLTQRVTVVR